MDKTTHLIHHPYTAPEGFAAPQVPVHKASTVIFSSVSAMRSRDWRRKDGYTYGLHGTPTTFTLEERIASLEGAQFAQLVPSGLAAIALVNLSLLKAGDEVLIPFNAYGPSLALAKGELSNYGITHVLYDPMSLADLSAKITPRTRLVWLEAAGSVTMEFPDLVQIVKLCKAQGVRCALDNTWGGGLAFNAFNLTSITHATSSTSATNEMLGVDISVQALTKYASGGGDVLMGSVCTRDLVLEHQLRLTHMRLGLGVSSVEAEIVLRSLPSMRLRYAAQDTSARRLAVHLSQCAEVVQLLHPAVQGSPGHENWAAVCESSGLAASIFSVVFRPEFTQDQVDVFCDSLKYFKIGYSWGGQMSLVIPYSLAEIRPTPNTRPLVREGHLVRLCIGLEDAEDLIQDVDQALRVAFKS
jgi:cystathionine beta-lyase